MMDDYFNEPFFLYVLSPFGLFMMSLGDEANVWNILVPMVNDLYCIHPFRFFDLYVHVRVKPWTSQSGQNFSSQQLKLR